MTWQPINTAPKDGTHILAYWPDVFGVTNATQCETWFGSWSSGGSEKCWQSAYEYGSDDNSPTYWMPLPPAPEVPK